MSHVPLCTTGNTIFPHPSMLAAGNIRFSFFFSPFFNKSIGDNGRDIFQGYKNQLGLSTEEAQVITNICVAIN